MSKILMAQIEFRAIIQINGLNPYVLVSKQNAEDLKKG
jgi:hypothetical protein